VMLIAPYSMTSLSQRSSIIYTKQNRHKVSIRWNTPCCIGLLFSH
jgi:hypothetical protein